jgi:hypothetical protein
MNGIYSSNLDSVHDTLAFSTAVGGWNKLKLEQSPSFVAGLETHPFCD